MPLPRRWACHHVCFYRQQSVLCPSNCLDFNFILAFFVLSELDFRFLRSTWVSVTLFSLSSIALIALFLIGKASHGAISWFSFGAFSLEPADPAN
jgi:cell division protein FtsW (lipid II flippase)